MVQNVSCTVSSCEYWSEGNICRASGILVAAGQPHSDWDPHGRHSEQYQHTPISNKPDSYCYTFEAVEAEEQKGPVERIAEKLGV